MTGLPPIAIFYGEDELLASEASQLALRAEAAGNDVLLRSVSDGQHSFIMGAGRVPEVDEAIKDIAPWLRLTLGHGLRGERSEAEPAHPRRTRGHRTTRRRRGAPAVS